MSRSAMDCRSVDWVKPKFVFGSDEKKDEVPFLNHFLQEDHIAAHSSEQFLLLQSRDDRGMRVCKHRF